MEVHPTELPGVLIIEPRVLRDSRGFFLETYQSERYAAAGIPGPFVQDNHSYSVRHILRGLHTQREFPQGKLVRCIAGEIWDVAVDIRIDSPAFGRWVGIRLSSDNFRQVWVPPGFAHGFCVLSETAQVEYKVTDYYNPKDELGLAWNDPEIGIEWPIASPILSEKDAANPRLASIRGLLPRYTDST
jgi:dTDP-4-dehydrorhamnose 3,5-epimerase